MSDRWSSPATLERDCHRQCNLLRYPHHRCSRRVSLSVSSRGCRVQPRVPKFFFSFSFLLIWGPPITQIYRDARSQSQVVIDVRLLLGLVDRRAARHRRHLPLGLLLPIPPISHRPLHRRLDGRGRSENLRALVQHWQVDSLGRHGHRLDHSNL